MRVFYTLLNITAQVSLFIVFLYCTSVVGYPMLAGAWPVEFLFLAIYLVSITKLDFQSGLRAKISLITISMGLIFILLYAGKANLETQRTELVANGIPNIHGVIWVFCICCAVVFTAIGISQIAKSVNKKVQQLNQ